MPKLVIGMSNKRGFTLVEILVVLLIVGITLGFAMLAFGDFGAKRRVMLSAEQFATYVKLVQQQAILETSTLGIVVTHNTYQVLRYSQSSNWQRFPEKSVFRKQKFSAPASVYFKPELNSDDSPQIIINESGDMNPFNLIVDLKGTTVAVVVGHHNGLIEVENKR